MPTKSLKHTGLKVASAGVAAVAAAAATAYYFAFDKGAQKHRQSAKNWAHKAKEEVIRELKKFKNVSKPAYEKAVRQIVKKYGEYEKAAPGEIEKLQKNLISYWQKISKAVSANAKIKAPVKKKQAKKKR